MFDKMKEMTLLASAMLLKFWKKNYSVEIKKDSSPVTEADKFMSSFLTKELKKIENIPVISEEDISQYEENLSRYWIVDPLDGTKDFINGGMDFAINIALIDKNMPLFSCIITPCFDKIYFSEFEKGSFLFHKNKIHKITFSKERKSIALVSKNHKNSLEDTFLKENNIKETQKVGASLKFCNMAMGEADIYARFDRLHSWDIAAGHLLVKEAGCQIIDLIILQEPSYEYPLLRRNPFIVLHKNYSFRELKTPCLD